MPGPCWLSIPAAVLVLTLTSLAANSPEQEKQPAPPVVDLYGDPLPEGAVGRLGTVRFKVGPLSEGLAFSPDGKILAAAGSFNHSAGCVWLWDSATGKPLQRIRIPYSDGAIAFSPDSKTLFLGNYRKLIDVDSGKVTNTLEGPEPRGDFASAFSPDGRTVAVAGHSSGPRLLLWDLGKPKEPRQFIGHTKHVRAVAFSPSGEFLASSGWDKIIIIWDVATGKETRRFEGHEGSKVLFVAFGPDGKLLVSASDNRTICFWDLETGNLLRTIRTERSEEGSVALSPDGKLVASGAASGMITLFDTATGKEVRRWRADTHRIWAMAFSPDGQVLVSAGGSDSALGRWVVATGEPIDSPAGHAERVEILRFAPDGNTLISCGRDARVMEWNLATSNNSDRFLSFPLGRSEADWQVFYHDLSVDARLFAMLRVSESGLKPDPLIRVQDTQSGKEVKGIKDIGIPKFLPNGELLISGPDGFRLWDISNGNEPQVVLKSPEKFERTFAVSPDGETLALPVRDFLKGDYAISLWSISQKKEIQRWDAHLASITYLVFSPEGATLAAVNWPDEKVRSRPLVRFWSVLTKIETTPINEPEGLPWNFRNCPVESVAYSLSGRLLAVATVQLSKTVGLDDLCGIHIFDMHSCKHIGQISVPQGSIHSLAFSPDGRTLASGGGDSTILLWDLTGYAIPGQHGKYRKPTPISDAEVQSLWTDLAGDATKAEKAIWTLAFSPKHSMPLLKERLQITPVPADEIAKLLAALESPTFAERQKAAAALEKLGDTAESAVRKYIDGKISPEAKQRLQQFLEKRDKDVSRKLRAIEVVEQIGTSEARELLQGLAKASPKPRVSEAAASALLRLDKRTGGR